MEECTLQQTLGVVIATCALDYNKNLQSYFAPDNRLEQKEKSLKSIGLNGLVRSNQ